jgi:outer membrane receptor for Fe3+-dicitrate
MYEQIEDFDENFYAFGVSYESGPITARAYSQGVTNDFASFFGVSGSYAVTNQIAVTGLIGSFDIFGSEASSFAIGGTYAVMDGLTADASIGMLDFEGDEATSISVGVTYALGDRKRLDREVRDAFVKDRVDAFGLFDADYGIGSGFLGFGA